MRINTSLRVSLKRVPVQPGHDDLSSFTFLYLTGLDDFHWDAGAVAALRRFLDAGGTLLINNSLGLHTFDAAVQRELKKVLPENELAPLPTTSPVFSFRFQNHRRRITRPPRARRIPASTSRGSKAFRCTAT